MSFNVNNLTILEAVATSNADLTYSSLTGPVVSTGGQGPIYLISNGGNLTVAGLSFGAQGTGVSGPIFIAGNLSWSSSTGMQSYLPLPTY